MSNFAECTLVKIVPSEPYFAALTTYDINHGRSSRFLLRLNDLAALVTDENAKPVLDTDIGSYIEITRRSMHLHFNHPGGTCSPSPEDIQSTIQLQRVLKEMGILVLDHIIVAGNKTYSLNQHGDINYRIR